MDIAMAASRSLSREISGAADKPILRGIHHLALVTDNMRMTLDFYVRVLGHADCARASNAVAPGGREPCTWERGAALLQHSPLFSRYGRRQFARLL
jgi:hypothetical protein